jgi:hypothetical protein
MAHGSSKHQDGGRLPLWPVQELGADDHSELSREANHGGRPPWAILGRQGVKGWAKVETPGKNFGLSHKCHAPRIFDVAR